MQSIPTLRLSYSHLLLKALERRGPATLEELLDVPDIENLFKSEREHKDPSGRAQQSLRHAMLCGLVEYESRRFRLTEVGRAYANRIDPVDPWQTTEDQAALLRTFFALGDDGLAQDVLLALRVQGQLAELGTPSSAEDFGRLLARNSHTDQWREARTFASQGARYRALLEDARLIDLSGNLTSDGAALLRDTAPLPMEPAHIHRPNVWWVNQGATYGKERDGNFIWAPLLNKAGRTQAHWDSLESVRSGDVILHYSRGFLRASSIVQESAQRSPNPLGTDAWEDNGRLVRTRYRDLNDPISLAAIPETLRIDHGAPFSVLGSVQQGYLYKVDETFAIELTDRFPELREALAEYTNSAGPTPVAAAVTPADAYNSFLAAVEVSGLIFPEGTNLVRSFISSLLAKPFVILTGQSGSGKTQLAIRLGEWFGHDASGRPNHLVVPVRPDWSGPEALFGYEDALRSTATGESIWFVPEPLEFIYRAAVDSTHPYLLILDEMNLAHVERYFADFLSGLESRKPLLPDLSRDDMRGHWISPAAGEPKLPLPRNLFVVGTVNVDETTYMFSPKVLDRASTFEFRVDASTLDPDLGRPSSAASAPGTVQRGFCDLAEDDEWHRQNPHPEIRLLSEALRQLHGILGKADSEFGHRTFYEVLRFTAFYAASGDENVDHALDLAIMQKLLPKVHGSRRRIEPLLLEIIAFAAEGSTSDVRLPLCHRKLRRMLEVVRANQFVSFTE